ncbi:MAG: FtsQ-type POTRA domain-containing protein [Deltaproteobacteria bacterium]|nr:FtsQ-type POTRA domain-containing protein [Deltaproteobacteria bacterium]
MARRRTKTNRYKKPASHRRGRLAALCRAAAVCGGFLVLFSVTGYAFLWMYDTAVHASCFTARSVEVSGNVRLTKQEILDRAGVAVGQNVLSVRLGQARERLLADPWIARATVRRQLPDKISIEVSEHVPMAVLDLGERFLMDTRGEIFKRAGAGECENLPMVRGLAFSDVTVAGQKPTPVYGAVVDFLRARRQTDWVLPGSVVSEIRVDRDLGLTVVAGRPAVAVHLGFDRFAEKLVRLHHVLDLNQGQGLRVKSVDLMDPDRVVIRPWGT